MSWSDRWAPYVSVDTRIRQATELAKKHAKAKGRSPQPVTVAGHRIATTFWGKAWCDNLETWKDYDNRLPRGKTYLRNGSVVDLFVSKLQVDAIVAGSEPYRISIKFTQLPDARWKKLRSECTANIDSLLDLLAGKFSKGLMELLTSTRTGLFPAAGEMRMSCDYPDSYSCCKHLAAVFYAIGAKLDHQPELLFALRGVDHQELVAHATSAENLDRELRFAGSSELQTDDLGQLFGIDLATGPVLPDPAATAHTETPPESTKKRSKKTIAAKPVQQQPPAVPVAAAETGTRPTKAAAPNPRRKPAKSSAVVAGEPAVVKAAAPQSPAGMSQASQPKVKAKPKVKASKPSTTAAVAADTGSESLLSAIARKLAEARTKPSSADAKPARRRAAKKSAK